MFGTMHCAYERHLWLADLSGAGGGSCTAGGILGDRVLDIVQNGISIAILDTSAACHMPDVLEMPYTPPLYGALPLSDFTKDTDTDPSYPQQSTGKREPTAPFFLYNHLPTK